jgi:hypothetical protein
MVNVFVLPCVTSCAGTWYYWHGSATWATGLCDEWMCSVLVGKLTPLLMLLSVAIVLIYDFKYGLWISMIVLYNSNPEAFLLYPDNPRGFQHIS